MQAVTQETNKILSLESENTLQKFPTTKIGSRILATTVLTALVVGTFGCATKQDSQDSTIDVLRSEELSKHKDLKMKLPKSLARFEQEIRQDLGENLGNLNNYSKFASKTMKENDILYLPVANAEEAQQLFLELKPKEKESANFKRLKDFGKNGDGNLAILIPYKDQSLAFIYFQDIATQATATAHLIRVLADAALITNEGRFTPPMKELVPRLNRRIMSNETCVTLEAVIKSPNIKEKEKRELKDIIELLKILY